MQVQTYEGPIKFDGPHHSVVEKYYVPVFRNALDIFDVPLPYANGTQFSNFITDLAGVANLTRGVNPFGTPGLTSLVKVHVFNLLCQFQSSFNILITAPLDTYSSVRPREGTIIIWSKYSYFCLVASHVLKLQKRFCRSVLNNHHVL